MAEPRLQAPLHDLGLAALAKPMDKSHGVWASEIPSMGVISLRGGSTDKVFVEAVSRALGFPLPVKPCSLAVSGDVKVLWISPDEWVIIAPRKACAAMHSASTEALKDIRSQVVDNSGGFTQIVLHGPNAADALSHCTVYDLAALGPGRVVGTMFGKSSVYLHRIGEGYCLILRRSFADYIWRFLARAAEPYGFGVARLEDLETVVLP